MSEITEIRPQVKDKERCSIFLDGRFYCGIKLEVAVKYRLKVGMHIDKATLDEIQLETEKSQALDKAMTHLSASMKTKKQIRDFLSGKGYTEAVCAFVIERLEYYGYVDDEAYCRAYISSVSGKGRRALEADLMKRGAEKSAIESVLEDFEESEEEAVEVLKKYMRGKQATKENIYKGYKYLTAKGYSYDTAKAAVDIFGSDDEDN